MKDGAVTGSPSDGVVVTFLPDGATAVVARGTRISVAGAAAGVFIDAPCGDRGICGKCRVQAAGALGPLTDAERKYLGRHILSSPGAGSGGVPGTDWRLACQATLEGDATIVVPRSSLQIAVDGAGREIALRPAARKIYLHLPEPSIEEARSAFTRLREALGLPDLRIGAAALRSLALAQGSTDGLTVTILDGPAELKVDPPASPGRADSPPGECIAVEPGDTSNQCFGLAFDVGTTTVVGSLVDLNTGREAAVSGALNEQALFGADVISRVKLANEDPEGLTRLHDRVVLVLNRLVDTLLSRSGVSREHVYEVTIVGNTCMHHLVLGVHPGSLGEAPYAATIQDAVAVRAVDVGLNLAPGARAYLLPIIAGHVGADTVGVVLATGLHRVDDVRLAVDIGTNGESVLGSRNGMVACSNAAGPAFEGTSIRQGMRATTGAIQGARIADSASGDVELSVIGDVAPTGICGSGLIDVVAELRLTGLIDPMGRLLGEDVATDGISVALRARLTTVEGDRAFRLSELNEPPVYLTQKDVRELQLAKGAIFAGIQILKAELGVQDQDIAEIDLAGAFGSYIRPESARVIGLIPNVPLDRVQSIGNAARIGARLALISTDARAEAEEIARTVAHQELFAQMDFLDEFTNAMLFPDPPPASEG